MSHGSRTFKSKKGREEVNDMEISKKDFENYVSSNENVVTQEIVTRGHCSLEFKLELIKKKE